jgi:hypothetical protein
VEAQLEEMALEITQALLRQMVPLAPVVVVVVRRADLEAVMAVVADQESSLFVMHCQLHRLFRRPRQLLALHARAQH